jgi:hypothetical protein
MEKEEFLPDDFLKGLFRNQPQDSPGDRFVENVMDRILQAPEAAAEKRSLVSYLRSSWIYVLLSLVCIVFLMTSDLPFTGYVPGKEYFTKNLLPYFDSLLAGIRPLFANSKVVSIVIMAIVAGGVLAGLDYFLSRKPFVRHQTSH